MADGGEKDVSSSKKLNVKAAAFVPKFGAQLASDVVGGVASKIPVAAPSGSIYQPDMATGIPMMNAYANGYVPYPIDLYAIMQQYNGLVMDMQQPLLYGTPTRYGGYPPVQSLSASAEYDSAQSAHADSARAATDKELKITENSTCTTGEDKFNDSSNIITDSQVVDLRADAVETNIVEEYVMVSKDVECPDNEEVLDCLAVSVPLDANDDTNQRAYTGKDEISGKLSLTTNHTLNFRYDRNLLLDIYSKMDATEIDPPMVIRNNYSGLSLIKRTPTSSAEVSSSLSKMNYGTVEKSTSPRGIRSNITKKGKRDGSDGRSNSGRFSRQVSADNLDDSFDDSVAGSYKSPFPLDKEDPFDPEVISRKANLILNKLSVTKFTKLSYEFMQSGIDHSKAALMKAVELIVTKAQMEEHFCFMYADLCKTIIDSWSTKPCTFLMKDIDVVREGNIIPEAAATSNCKEDQNRSMGSFFRNLLLERCQGEFEFDRVAALEKIKNNIDFDEDIRTEKEILLKKRYTGHMAFIGEIYKKDLVKASIMKESCLDVLIQSKEEEDLVCMCKLFATIGSKLDQYYSEKAGLAGKKSKSRKGTSSKFAEVIPGYFEKILELANNHSVARVRFMLKDLIEMRENGWISRRDAEKVMDLSESRKAVEETDVTQKRASITPILQLGKGDARVLPPPDDWEVVPVGGKKKISTSQPPNSKAPFKPDNRSSQLKNNSKSKNIAVANLPVTDTRKKLVLTKEAVSPGFTDERLADHPSAGSANSNATIYRESGLNKSDLSIFFVSVDEFVLNFNGDSALSECALCIKELVHQQNMDDAVKFLLVISLEKKEKYRSAVCFLLSSLLDSSHTSCLEPSLRTLSRHNLENGIYKVLDEFDDHCIDTPLAGTYLSHMIAELVAKGTIVLDVFIRIPNNNMFWESPRSAELIVRTVSSVLKKDKELLDPNLLIYLKHKLTDILIPSPLKSFADTLLELCEKTGCPANLFS